MTWSSLSPAATRLGFCKLHAVPWHWGEGALPTSTDRPFCLLRRTPSSDAVGAVSTPSDQILVSNTIL